MRILGGVGTTLRARSGFKALGASHREHACRVYATNFKPLSSTDDSFKQKWLSTGHNTTLATKYTPMNLNDKHEEHRSRTSELHVLRVL